MRGIGAIVFLVTFLVMLLATLAAPTLPFGRQLYDLFGIPESDYPVLGIPVTILVSAVLNGVLYGAIAWLIFTFAKRYWTRVQVLSTKASIERAITSAMVGIVAAVLGLARIAFLISEPSRHLYQDRLQRNRRKSLDRPEHRAETVI